MRDSIELKINGQVLTDFVSFNIEQRMYEAASLFNVSIAKQTVDVMAGDEFELFVNDQLEMVGIIDRVRKGYKKAERSISLEGRDFMGLLVDSYCEQFITLENMSLQRIAETLLAKIPFINRKSIVYEKATQRYDGEKQLTQIEPGTTIFEALKNAAISRGLLFHCMPNGAIAFGKPKANGPALMSLIVKDKYNDSDILEAEVVEDISQRYSKITILGQQQGSDDFDVSDINVAATALDDTMPFYKPYVQSVNEESVNARSVARKTLEQQRAGGQMLHYIVRGFSQRGTNWSINQLCRVDDEELDIHKVFLVYGRSFSLSRGQGAITNLDLGMPGVLS
jgi:prophage tail gpP-like protein